MEPTSVPAAQPAKKLGEGIFFAYGLQEFAMGFLTMLGVQFIGFFLTNVAFFGVVGGAAIAATILSVGRFVDIFTVPVVGVIVEKSNLPWGKYGSWLFIMAPLVTIFTVLMFTDFGLGVNATAVLITTFYLLMFITINFCSTARFSLLPVFTKDPDERAKLSIRRAQGAAIGTGIRGFITLPLVVMLGGGAAAHLGGRNTQGFVLTALIYGIFTILGLYLIAYLARPYEKKIKEANLQGGPKPATVKDMLRVLGTNKPLLIFVLANTMTLTATNVLTGFNLFYFNYVVGSIMLFAFMMPITFGGHFVGNTVATFLVRKYKNNKTVYIIGMIIYAIFMASVYFIAGGRAEVFIALVAFAQFGNGIAIGLAPAIFSDIADYGELQVGKSVRAAVMALVIFPIKIGVFLGGSIAAWALVGIGFVAGTYDPAVISGIQFWIAIPNAGFGVLAAIIMLAYPLSRSRMQEIHQQLRDKAAAQGN